MQSQEVQVQEDHSRRPEAKVHGVGNRCNRNRVPQIVLLALGELRTNSMDSSHYTCTGSVECNCSSSRR